jgi:hypothetical protein
MSVGHEILIVSLKTNLFCLLADLAQMYYLLTLRPESLNYSLRVIFAPLKGHT